MSLAEYVHKHTMRGECTCGRCIDAVKDPETHQPDGHTIDMTFFKVALRNDPDKKTFLKFVEDEFPTMLDGGEHSYIELGALMGDQGIAIQTIGMGGLLGVWQALSPAMLDLPKHIELMMAGNGMIALVYDKGDNDES